MKALKFLTTLFTWVLVGAVFAVLAVIVVGWCLPRTGPQARLLADISRVCNAVSGGAVALLGVAQLVSWFVTTGKNQTAAAPTGPSRTADIEPRTFRFRSVGFHVGMSRVLAGLFLLPLVGAAVAAFFPVKLNGWLPLWALLGGLGVLLAPFAWVFWKLGLRYANSRVTVDRTGVEVQGVYSTGRFGWGEITAFTKEERDLGAIRNQWFFVLYAGDRVLQVEPWVNEPDEFAAAVERASGLTLRVIPLYGVPTEHRRKWARKAG